MADGVAVSAMVDLVNGTKDKYQKGMRLTFDNPKTEFVNTFLANEETLFEGQQTGKSFKGNVQTSASENAEEVTLLEESEIRIEEFSSQWECPWAFTRTHWGFDVNEEAMNAGDERIMNVIEERRIITNVGWADRQEAMAWASRTSDQTKQINGFPHYLPGLIDSQAGEGFYGCYPTTTAGAAHGTDGFSTVLGIAPCTGSPNTTAPTGGKSRWRSYAAGGTDYYDTGGFDLTALDTLKNMYDRINFISPMVEGVPSEKVSRFRLYTNLHVIREAERLARNQNDQVGPDLAAYMGRTAFRRLIPRYVPTLDADLRDPVYMVNLNDFRVRALKGRWSVEDKAVQVSARVPTAFVVWKHWAYNLACVNRQTSGVMRKTAARS